MRVALHSVLREGHEAAYDAAHERIPDDLAELFAANGITDWSIWRSGRDIFHLVDCEDFDAAMTAVADHPANVAWQATINEHVDHFIPAVLTGLPHVWQLTRQTTTATDSK